MKIDVDKALELRKSFQVEQNNLIPDLLAVLTATGLHKHPLLLKDALIVQGKVNCMPATAVAPNPDREVLDSCDAPGNKSVELAVLMKGKGNILACGSTRKGLSNPLGFILLQLWNSFSVLGSPTS